MLKKKLKCLTCSKYGVGLQGVVVTPAHGVSTENHGGFTL